MHTQKIDITGIHIELTDALKNAVHQKMQKLFEHEPRVDRVTVELKHDPHSTSHENEYIAQGHLAFSGKDVVIKEAGNDLYNCINQMADKLERQLRKIGERKIHDRKHPRDVEIDASIPKT